MRLRQDHIVSQQQSKYRIDLVVEIKLFEVPVLRKQVVDGQRVLGLCFDPLRHFPFVLVDLEHRVGRVPHLLPAQGLGYERVALVLDLLHMSSWIKGLSSHAGYLNSPSGKGQHV